MKYIDLHAHTKASDGSLTPAELVRLAKTRGLAAVAVTDHDTIAGIAEAVAEGLAIGIEVIPGVEIGVDFLPEMHILGYFIGTDPEVLEDVLKDLRVSRDTRNPRIIAKLNELGFNITIEEVQASVKGNVLGRPHIAKVMARKGYINTPQEAFDKYLAIGKPAYFKKDKLTPEKGIAEITAAGGIAVLAHPMYLGKSPEELDKLLSRLKAAGLGGLEVYYSEHTGEQTALYLELARKHKLLVTGGSDFHGSFRGDIELGKGRGNLRIPYELLDELKAYKGL